MTKRWILAALAAATMTLSSCAYDTGEGYTGESPDQATTTTTSMPAPADEAAIGVAPTSLGDIVVDAGGMSVYVYGMDEVGSGVTTCDGSCLESWKPVTTTTEEPKAEGIDAEIGTIPANNDAFQVTVNGRALYRYVDDMEPGDVFGQSVEDLWFALDPAGNPIYEPPVG